MKLFIHLENEIKNGTPRRWTTLYEAFPRQRYSFLTNEDKVLPRAMLLVQASRIGKARAIPLLKWAMESADDDLVEQGALGSCRNRYERSP